MCQQPTASSLSEDKNKEMKEKLDSIWAGRNTGIAAVRLNMTEANNGILPYGTIMFVDEHQMNHLSNISTTFGDLDLNIRAATGAPLDQYHRQDTFTVTGPKGNLLFLINYLREREEHHVTLANKNHKPPPLHLPFYIAATLDDRPMQLSEFCQPLKDALLLSHQCRANEDNSKTSALLMKVKASSDKAISKAVREIADRGFKINGWGAIQTNVKSAT